MTEPVGGGPGRKTPVLHFGRIPAFAVRDSIARAHSEYAGDCSV